MTFGEEPKEVSAVERPLQPDTENTEGTRQIIEIENRQETLQAPVVEPQLEETEAPQPETSTDARPPMEESPEEVDMQDQEESVRITPSSSPSRGQGGSRK